MKSLEEYISYFTRLRRAPNLGGAPHKPILLLSVIDAIEKGYIVNERIYITAELITLFKSNWKIWVRTQHIMRFGLPFYHLKNEPFWRLLVVAVINSPKHDFNRCKSVIYKFLSRDPKSARDKNGTKPRKNKVKNTSPEISLVEYLCFVCKGTNLSLEKRGEIPISLIHNSFSYHCTPNVVIANGFDLKRLGLRKLGVKFCFALCWTFSKTRTGNRTKDLPPLLSNTWFCECLNDRHLKMLNFK